MKIKIVLLCISIFSLIKTVPVTVTVINRTNTPIKFVLFSSTGKGLNGSRMYDFDVAGTVNATRILIFELDSAPYIEMYAYPTFLSAQADTNPKGHGIKQVGFDRNIYNDIQVYGSGITKNIIQHGGSFAFA